MSRTITALFDQRSDADAGPMSWRQPDLFCGEKQPAKTLPPGRAYRPPARSAPKPFAWESMGG